MRKINLHKLTAILAVVALLVCVVGTLAYYTDRVEGNASINTVKNGVDIEPNPDPTVEPDDPTKPDPEDYKDPTPNDPTDDLTNWWIYLNSRAMANFNPGDKMTLNYILSNVGDLAVDVRETFIVTSSVPLSGVPEFRLFSSFTNDAAGANIGVEVVTNEARIDGTTYQYKYTVEPYILSSEKETVGSAPVELGREYYLVFAAGSGNEFQGATCTVEYVVEAKQHSEGGAADWQIATTGTINLPVSGQTLPVVPAK